jgi:hypothetical protein
MNTGKRYHAVLKYRDDEGKVKEHILQAGNRILLNLLCGKFMVGHDLVSTEIYDQRTGEMVEKVDMNAIRSSISEQCMRAGFKLPSEEEDILFTASVSDEDILKIAKQSMKKYKETGNVEYHASFIESHKILKRRGIKDQEVEDFAKKYPWEKAMRKFAMQKGIKGNLPL